MFEIYRLIKYWNEYIVLLTKKVVQKKLFLAEKTHLNSSRLVEYILWTNTLWKACFTYIG